MEALQTFSCTEFGAVRTVTIDGKPWFVGKDVAGALGYTDANQAVRKRVDNEDRKTIDGKTQRHFDVELGQRGGWIINESGLYSLILSSKLPSAKKFKHWVTSEVLPALRKTGSYTMKERGAVSSRPLTTDDYLSAAQIISRCTDSRLPIVLDLLDRGGFDTAKLEQAVKQQAVPRRKGRQLQKPTFISDDPLIQLLWQHTTTEVERLTGIGRGSISFYRRGLRKCPDDRRAIIMDALA